MKLHCLKHLGVTTIKIQKGKRAILFFNLSVAVSLLLCTTFLLTVFSYENTYQSHAVNGISPFTIYTSAADIPKEEITVSQAQKDDESNGSDEPVSIEPVIDPLSSSLDWSFTYEEINEEELILLAQLIQGEAGSSGLTQKAAIVWVVFNRIDNGYGTLSEVVTGGAFYGWGDWQECTEENKLLAKDVYIRWQAEQAGFTEVGRVIPANCCHFSGNGMRNLFRVGGLKGEVWDFSLPSPYNS
ncbi:MAG: hypothetical protein HFE77_03925 [Clostridiales bacterium]|nr:hypothetical protein [Clostridiales bacterium]